MKAETDRQESVIGFNQQRLAELADQNARAGSDVVQFTERRSIAEALIATGLGLGVAIPAVWFYNYFQTKIENLTAEMTHISKYVIDYLIRGMSGEFGRSRFTREFSTKATGGSAPISQ